MTKGGTQRGGGLRLRKVESMRNKGRLADWPTADLPGAVVQAGARCGLPHHFSSPEAGILPPIPTLPNLEVTVRPDTYYY